jgi:ubiquitin carboxyl-terminal hydrolase 4/11/15
LSWSSTGLHGRLPTSTTASTKKRKTVTGHTTDRRDDSTRQPPNEEPVASPRSSPHPAASTRASASPPPPRFLPPHLHDEVLTDSDQASTLREHSPGASSPSEAYAGLTLGDVSSMADEGTAPPDQVPQQRRAPRSSSPAKRLHSDMADDNMDVDAASTPRPSGQASPRNTKPLPTAASQRSARATSVEMADAPNSGSSEPDASNADSSTTSMNAEVDLPSLDEQVTKVMTMMQAPLRERQEGYIISEKWLERVWARTSENSGRPQEFSKEATQGPIGPVDNAGLVDADALQDDLMDHSGEDFVPLSKAAQMGQDFEVLPAKAWELVVSWYGLKDGSPVIRRYAQNTVPDKSSENLEYELNPPVLTIRKVRKAPAAADTTKLAAKIVASRYESFLTFLEAAKKAAGIDLKNKVRVWRILNTASSDVPQDAQASGMLTPDASPRDGSPAVPASNQRCPLIMDVASFNTLAPGTDREMVTGKDEKANEDFNDLLTLDGAGVSQSQIIVLEEHDEKGEYISDTSKVASKTKTGAQAKSLQSTSNSGRSTPTSGALTRGRAKNGKVRGHVGLTNLGNTCYMNSALQCLRSVEELSMYFLSNKWKHDINVTNPIGHKGAIARVYAGLLSGIYDLNAVSSFSPKNFKNTLGKANSLFSGYGQQDSQEFVSWLVDALHEDLNRVLKKPYAENPDSDDNTFRDPEAVKKLGEIYRSNHKARNDSVSMDLFSGFYKNTMVCPECEKVSITFDPYSQLTLQLPIEQTWTHTITYVPLHGTPYQLEIDMDKNASIKSLKEYVGKRNGNVPASHLMASEVYSHKYYRHLDDKSSIAESNIGVRDDIFIYELDMAPSNWPAPKKKGSKYRMILSQGSSDEDIPDSATPLHDRVIIPVFHRGPNMASYRPQNYSMALWPFFIVLTREEAKDNDAILRKILAKVAQMTTRPILSEVGDAPLDQSRNGSDVVLTTEEDASPNGDPRVHDGSVEGDDIVEVTMTDDDDKIPAVLKPGSFIDPQLRTLFEIKHTRKSSEVVTTGWSTVDPSKTLEPISSRIRIPPSREESVQSSQAGSEASSSDEDADTPQSIDAEATIEAANVSSDEEMQSVEIADHGNARGGRQSKKKSKKARKRELKLERKHKNNKNFKSKKRVPDQPNYPDEPDDESDDRLIRMGEALVLEWEPNSFEALFGGTTADDPRGMEAMKDIKMREDPEIQEKKARRAARRKNGITLDECFTETSKSEILSEDNAWYCSRCKELRRATKTLEIWTVPDILIIHLKRFSGHRSFRDKIEELIDFPVEGLDLSGKVGFPEDKDLTYDLFAVDNHFGGLGGGHYTATAQNFFDKQWYDYNGKSMSGPHAVEVHH